MPRRLAASISLLVFAICLIAGIEAGNTLATVLGRSLLAMGGTLVVSLVVGAMAQRMLDENLSQKEAALKQAQEAANAESTAPDAGANPRPGGR